MTRRHVWGIAALVLVVGGSAAALKAGETVFVRTRDTRVFADTTGTRAVGKPLQPGEKLTWLEQAQRYHKVKTSSGATGYVWYQNLSTTAPRTEVVVDKATGASGNVGAQAFASHGAAARGLTSGAVESAKLSNNTVNAENLRKVEELSKQIDQADLEAFGKKRSLQAEAQR